MRFGNGGMAVIAEVSRTMQLKAIGQVQFLGAVFNERKGEAIDIAIME